MSAGPGRVDPLFLEFQSALVGRYSLDRELGRGGMGIVYLAREVQLDRPVAIKLLPPERAMDDTLRERFVREARMAARLSHPNIIPIFAVDEAEGFVFYVMAYVDGETLGERVRARGPLPASEATRVMREVTWALAHAHAQGVVHRDVKPDNILLERGTGRALVTDFGIAAAVGVDESPAAAGTPEFMSPEQALGGELDGRSDLYGVGATAYFVLTGRAPFTGRRTVDVLAQQVALPAPPLAGAGVAVPRRLAHLVERCLEKEPARRPASAEQLADQLGAAVEGRREIPAALRAFAKRDSRFLGAGSLFAGYVSLTGTAGLVTELGVLPGLGVAAGILLSIPFGGMVWSARAIQRRGFGLPDVRMAFEHEIEVLREEFHASGRVERPRLERAGGMIALTGVAAMVGGMASFVVPAIGGVLDPGRAGWVAWSGGVLAIAGLALRQFLRRGRPHASAQSWARLWTGRVGQAAFAVARRLGGTPAQGAATTHRATEMALGMAADELYASLPRETRRALGDVPALARRLQRDATELRTALDGLQEALDVAGAAAATDDAYRSTRALRDEVAERHRQAVATLEALRLNLLRLHAGAITVQGFTTEIDQAGDVATEVRRLLEARGELERYLRFPTPATDTPA